jgi:hypothetical protein
VFRTQFRRWHYVVLRRKECSPSQPFASGKRIQFQKSVPENFTNSGSRPFLIIIDDLLNEVYSKDVCHLFTKGSHHRYRSVILITQNLFHQWLYCRDISLKAKYIVLLKKFRGKNQFTYLAGQVFPQYSSDRTRPIWMRPQNPTVISC